MFQFLKDNMASKADLAAVETRLDARMDGITNRMVNKDDLSGFATKEDLIAFKSEILSHIDTVMSKHSKFELELVAINDNYQRHDRQIQQLAAKYKIKLTD